MALVIIAMVDGKEKDIPLKGGNLRKFRSFPSYRAQEEFLKGMLRATSVKMIGIRS